MAKQRVDIVVAAKDRASRKMSGIAKAAVGMAAAFVSWRAIKSTVSDLIGAYGEQEQAEAKLQQALKATGGAAGFSFKQLKQYAAQLQKTTTYGDELTIEMMSLLATFKNVQGPVFTESTRLILDMSTAMGQDLKSTAIMVGKALNDPAKALSALSRNGVQFTDQQKEQIEQFVEVNDLASAQSIILNELTSQFGGQAAAAAETFSGKLQSLSNSWGDAKEEMGKYLAQSPVFIDTIKAAQFAMADFDASMKIFWMGIKLTLVEYWEDFKFLFTGQIPNVLNWLGRNFVDVFKNAFKMIATMMLNMAEYIYTIFQTMISNLKAALSTLWDFIKNPSGGLDLGGLFEEIGSNFLKQFKEMNPFENAGLDELEIKWKEGLKFKSRDKTAAETALEDEMARLMQGMADRAKSSYKLPNGGPGGAAGGDLNSDSVNRALGFSKRRVAAVEARFLHGTTMARDPAKEGVSEQKKTNSLLRELVRAVKENDPNAPARTSIENALRKAAFVQTAFI